MFDVHGFHLSGGFVDYCWQDKIRPFLLPPYLRHVLRPLDTGIYPTLKQNSRKLFVVKYFLGRQELKKWKCVENQHEVKFRAMIMALVYI